MNLDIPAPLKVEHEALHDTLKQATREPGAVGDAAREVARLLHPHFVREEEFAMPPLGLLSALATGAPRADMAEVIDIGRRLEAELPAMLAEHGEIVRALSQLEAAARAAGLPQYEKFASDLTLHAQTEEQVLYPASILVGKYLALALGQGKQA
jgi:hypothetical protein